MRAAVDRRQRSTPRGAFAFVGRQSCPPTATDNGSLPSGAERLFEHMRHLSRPSLAEGPARLGSVSHPRKARRESIGAAVHVCAQRD